MSRKKDRRFGSWTDAEIAYEVASKMLSILDTALAELVRGRVKWIEGAAPRKIGLCQLTASHGGVVIIVEREMVGARYLTEWADTVQAVPAPDVPTYRLEYKAWLDIRRLATAAITERDAARVKASEAAQGCARSGLPGVVDQDVRSY